MNAQEVKTVRAKLAALGFEMQNSIRGLENTWRYSFGANSYNQVRVTLSRKETGSGTEFYRGYVVTYGKARNTRNTLDADFLVTSAAEFIQWMREKLNDRA